MTMARIVLFIFVGIPCLIILGHWINDAMH